jgi:filamentous hemagglutinin family protein
MSTSIRSRRHRRQFERVGQALGFALILEQAVTGAFAQAIRPDGSTATSVTPRGGGLYDVTTTTQVNANAFNSFSTFSVLPGQTVNLHVPSAAQNLLNIVRDARTDISGVLNAYKDGRIGGNVYFANPHGFVVGAAGVVNVGSLHVTTPTQGFADRFFLAPGVPNAEATAQLLAGNAPIGGTGLISIAGRINAADAVTLRGGTVSVAGAIVAGPQALAAFPTVTEVVNVQGLAAGAQMVADGAGRIRIVAAQDVAITGTLAADGAPGKSAGEVSVTAYGNLGISGDAVLSARGFGAASDGGAVTVFAHGDATLADRALLDASGGGISGDGGRVHFSGARAVHLRGGAIEAGTVAGKAGSILIDPPTLDISNAGTPATVRLSGGALVTFSADDEITVGPGTLISSRRIADRFNGNHETDDSVGDSGSIVLAAPNITIGTGAKLLAHAIQGGQPSTTHAAGDITLTATDQRFALENRAVYRNAQSSIDLNAATLRGRNVTMQALADNAYLFDADSEGKELAEGLLNTIFATVNQPIVGASVASSTATITLQGTTDVQASGTLSLNATADSAVTIKTLGYVAALGYGRSEANASVTVGAASKLQAAGDVTIESKIKNAMQLDGSVEIESERVPVDIVAAVGEAYGTAATTLARGSQITSTGGGVKLASESVKSMSVNAEVGAAKEFLGAAVAVSLSNTAARTLIAGTVTAQGNVELLAKSNTESNETSAASAINAEQTAGAITDPKRKSLMSKAAMLTSGFSDWLASKTEQKAEIAEESGGSSGFMKENGIAAAVAYAEHAGTAEATLQTGGALRSRAAATVSAVVEDRMQNSAISEISAEKTGSGEATKEEPRKRAIAAGVLIGSYTSTAHATVETGARIDATGAVTVSSAATVPYEQNWTNWKIKSFDDFVTVKDRFATDLGVKDGLFTTWVQSTGEGQDLGVAASVNVLDLVADSRARVQGGAFINQDAAYRGTAQDVSVTARSDLQTVNLGGVFGNVIEEPESLRKPIPVIKPPTGVTSGKGSLGGTYLGLDYDPTTEALIDSGANVFARDAAVTADTVTSNISIAASGASAGKYAVSGTFSMVDVTGRTTARIDDGATVTAQRALTVQAKDDAFDLNVVGGAAVAQNAGAGVAIGINDYDRVTQAVIGNVVGDATQLSSAGTIGAGGLLQLRAENTGDIVSVALAAAVRSKQPDAPKADKVKQAGDGKGSFGLQVSGDVSWNRIQDTTRAYVNGGAAVTSGTPGAAAGADAPLSLSLSATNDSDIYAIAGAVSANLQGGQSLGLAGSYTQNDLQGNGTDAFIAGSGQVTSKGDARLFAQRDGSILSIAASGSGSAGGDGFSLAGSVAYSEITNTTAAYVKDAKLDVQDAGTDKGDLTLHAEDLSDIFSVGGAATLGGKGGFGAGVSANIVRNGTSAYIEDSVVKSGGDMSLAAHTDSDIFSVAASIGGSKAFSISGAGSGNTITNTTRTSIDNAGLAAKDVAVGGNLTLAAQDDSLIQAIAASGGAAKQAGVGASVAVNLITNTVESAFTDAAVTGTTGNRTLTAASNATIESLAGAVGIGGNAGVGVAVAVNRIANTTAAHVGGASAVLRGKDILVDADSAATIRTIAVGIGGGGDVGIAGSAATNFIAGATRSHIDGGAQVTAEDDVGVIAAGDDRITVAAGSVGVGGSAAGIGASVAVNDVDTTTEAFVEDAATRVAANGADASGNFTVASGALAADVDLGKAVDLANYAAIDLSGAKATKAVNGLAVNASGTQVIETINAAIAGSGGAAIGLNANVNLIGGVTRAYVADARVNEANAGTQASQSVDVTSSNHAYGNGFIGNVAVGQVGVGVASDNHIFARTTEAYVDRAAVEARGAVDVTAQATMGGSSVAVGGGGGIAAIAGTGALIKFTATTTARVASSNIDAARLGVRADSANDLHVVAGAVTIGGAAVSGTFAVGLSNNTTVATITGTAADRSDIDVTGAVTVAAESRTGIKDYAIGGAFAGAAGVAGAVAVNLVTNATEATVSYADIGAIDARAGSLAVGASDTTTIRSVAGGVGAGGLAGVGAGATVNVFKNRVIASVDDATVYTAGAVTLTAGNTKQVDSYAAMAGFGGTIGIGGAAAVTLVGDSVQGEAAAELDSGGGGTLSKVDDNANADRFASLSTSDDRILSSADRTKLQGKAGAGVKSTAAGDALQYRTAAEVTGDAAVDAASVAVTAADATRLNTVVGSAAAGAVGIGGAVGITSTKSNVQALATGTITTAGTLTVSATAGASGDNDAVEIAAVAGSAGLVGVGAAVASADIDNAVSAAVGGNVNAAAVNVTAADRTDAHVTAFGATAGGVAVGAVIARADKSSHVTAETLDTTTAAAALGDGHITADAVTLGAVSSGAVRGSASGGAVGAFSGAAMDVRVTDGATVTAATGDHTVLALGDGTLTLSAEALPEASAAATGVSIAGGVNVGVSIAQATASANVESALGAGSRVTAGNIGVTARQARSAGADNAHAAAFAAGGGLLVGINATQADAALTGLVQARVGDDATLEVASGNIMVRAERDARQSVSVDAFNGGIAALGANVGHAQSAVTTQARLGDRASINATTLDLAAVATERNFAATTSGSGGVVSGVSATARTTTASNTSALVGRGADARKVGVGALRVRAEHTGVVNATVDSINASVAGASGAHAINDVTAVVTAGLDAGARVAASEIALDAISHTDKPWLDGQGNGDVAPWNVKSGSGGVIDAPAGSSTTVIRHATEAVVGPNAQIAVLKPHAGTALFRADAFNDIVARDKVRLDSGGAIAIAKASSSLVVERSDARVRFAPGSTLTSAAGDVIVGASANADLESRAAADTYGLAGSPQGSAHSYYTGLNDVLVDGATITVEDGNAVLAAGESSTAQLNRIVARSRVNLWNKTVIPFNGTPDAQSFVTNDAAVRILGNGAVATAGDIGLYATKGIQSLDATGIGKDIYREALAAVASFFSNLFGGGDVSFDIHGGETGEGGRRVVRVDGRALAGYDPTRSLNLDYRILLGAHDDVMRNPDGSIQWAVVGTGKGIGYDTRYAVPIAQSIRDRIQHLRTRRTQYAGDAIAVAAYDIEIAFLEKKLIDLNLATRDVPGTASSASERQAAQAQLDVSQTLLVTQRAAVVDADSRLNTPVSGLLARRNAKQDELAATTLPKTLTEVDALLAAEQEKTTPDATVIAGLQVQRQLITDVAGLVTAVIAATSELDAAQREVTRLSAEVDTLTASLPTLSTVTPDGPAAPFITVRPVHVRLGNLRVKADDLVGTGTIAAPGNAEIRIVNNTPAFLVVGDLTIGSDDGGRIMLNGFEVSSREDVTRLNRSRESAGFAVVTTGATTRTPPEISIESRFVPDTVERNGLLAPSPDIQITGELRNLRGGVSVTSASGSIMVTETANIHAATVNVRADNGDFVQSYVDNFFHVGGDPAALWRASALEPKGIVANGGVFISARWLNINGLIQSGIDDWHLTLPETPILTGTAESLGLTATEANALIRYRDEYLAARETNPAIDPYQTVRDHADPARRIRYNAALQRLEVSVPWAIADQQTAAGRARNERGLYALVSDYGNVGARYDTALDRFVLNGTEVNGGYIQLFGQIMNTANVVPDGAGGGRLATNTGQLRVLDGFGSINVTNPTGRDVVVGKLSTGRGVVGMIDITDVQSFDVSGNPLSIRTQITRLDDKVATRSKTGVGVPQFDASDVFVTDAAAPAGQRATSYAPQSGVRFVWTSGTDRSTETRYRWEGNSLFGFIDLGEHLDSATLLYTRTLSNYDLLEGRFAAVNRSEYGTAPYSQLADPPVANGTPTWTDNGSGSSCNWWSLCLSQHYWREATLTEPTKTITHNSLKADYPISITFGGSNTGAINVLSAANVVLTGDVTNRAGTVTVKAGDATVAHAGVSTVNRAIVQGNDTALITARDVNLAATGTIGAAPSPNAVEQAVRLNAVGTLTASAQSGNVRAEQVIGTLAAGNVTAAEGVYLTGEAGIVRAAGDVALRGKRVVLDSPSGGLGTVARPLVLETGYTDDAAALGAYGLRAEARGDIHLTQRAWAGNPAGDLLVDRVVSTTGDVRLEAPGHLIDNNLVESVDKRTWGELLAFWDTMRLVENSDANAQKQGDAIRAFEQGVTRDYRTYWQTRLRQADPSAYDASFRFVYRADERATVRSQLVAQGVLPKDVDDRVTALEIERTSEYHRLHRVASTLNGGAYAVDWRYQATEAERAARLAGSSWTERELGLAVTPGLIKTLTDTNPIVKDPNVRGARVTLVAGQGIGVTRALPAIASDVHPSALSDAQKVALAAAERSDLIVTDAQLTVLERKPMNVEATASIDVANPLGNAVMGNVFLASESDARLGTLRAAGETRVKVAGSIVNADAFGAGFEGDDLVLEAARGSIGTSATPLRVALGTTGTLTVRGRAGVNVEQFGTLLLDSAYSPADVRLAATGSVRDAYADGDTDILARNITLTARTGDVMLGPIKAAERATVHAWDGIYLPRLDAGTGFAFSANVIDANVLDSTAGGTLLGTVVGSRSPAAYTELDLASVSGVTFDRLWTVDGVIRMLGEGRLDILSGFVGQRLRASNPYTRVLVDNASLGLALDADVQLYAPAHWLSMSLWGNNVATDAFVINRGQFHNVFSPNGEGITALQAANDALADIAEVPGLRRRPRGAVATTVVQPGSPAVSIEGMQDERKR